VSILVISLLIAFATATALSRAKNSGADGGGAPSADSQAWRFVAHAAAPENCPAVRRAVRFYRVRYVEWTRLRGAVAVPSRMQRPTSCPKYLAHLWKRKAFQARRAYERWHAYHYDWRSWLPPVWKRIIACETFSNFRHNSGTYQGAFGFHYGSWDRFKLAGYPDEAYEATPRQQYEVALAIWRRYGLSGWGCA